ncbi:imidazoleglycerol-phosphate dehydratase HisB [Candidatus Solincola tengchongensis]|uniref:imidazoleglycerol-phosphate dehydratase HisB n=1 Tax=Candidatus Solincola tengchongensis TaxID=2900693 RepID=UPI0025803A69|nr:imidazoleglycerol-phosphate dehydratase HisB [Candidatus Solincola tengchongensis]
MSERSSVVERITGETRVSVNLRLDGTGEVDVSTGIAFFDHMLTLFAFHAGFDLRLQARGDLEVDQHHTVEDVGLCLGSAIREALGDKRGIRRYGWALLPMDEALCLTALDISGRPHLSYGVDLPVQLISDFDPTCVREFLQALVNQGGFTLHVRGMAGENPHHILEAVFKGLGRALREAVLRDAGMEVPSTKGSL